LFCLSNLWIIQIKLNLWRGYTACNTAHNIGLVSITTIIFICNSTQTHCKCLVCSTWNIAGSIVIKGRTVKPSKNNRLVQSVWSCSFCRTSFKWWALNDRIGRGPATTISNVVKLIVWLAPLDSIRFEYSRTNNISIAIIIDREWLLRISANSQTKYWWCYIACLQESC